MQIKNNFEIYYFKELTKIKLNIIIDIFTRGILNYIGAIIRFIIGTIYRKMFNKTTNTFKDYLNGQKEEGKNYISYNNKHQRENRFVASFIIILLFYIGYLIFK